MATTSEKTLTKEDLEQRLTISAWPEAGQVLGISRSATYAGIHAGSIPSLRIGSRILVPVAPLLKMLGALVD